MLTSEELGVNRLTVGEDVYMFDWSRSITSQLCVGKVIGLVSTKDYPEGYIVESVVGEFDKNKVYFRIEIEKAPKEGNWAIKKHIKDLRNFVMNTYYKD